MEHACTPGKGMNDWTHLLASALATDVCLLFQFEQPLGHNDIVAPFFWPGHTPNGPTPCCLADHFFSADSLTLERAE